MTVTPALEAERYVEARFPCEVGPATAWSDTGEPYVALVVGGVKPEGDAYPGFLPLPDAAVVGWCKSFD